MFNYWAEFYVSTNTKNPVQNAFSLRNHTESWQNAVEIHMSASWAMNCRHRVQFQPLPTKLGFRLQRESLTVCKKIQQHQNRLTQLNSLELFFVPVWFWEWFCGFSVGHSLHFIHHLLKVNEVTAFDRNDWNISHSSELTAVVQMLVLETKEIPDKTPKTTIQWQKTISWQIQPPGRFLLDHPAPTAGWHRHRSPACPHVTLPWPSQ